MGSIIDWPTKYLLDDRPTNHWHVQIAAYRIGGFLFLRGDFEKAACDFWAEVYIVIKRLIIEELTKYLHDDSPAHHCAVTKKPLKSGFFVFLRAGFLDWLQLPSNSGIETLPSFIGRRYSVPFIPARSRTRFWRNEPCLYFDVHLDVSIKNKLSSGRASLKTDVASSTDLK